jgi:hypothetical protein
MTTIPDNSPRAPLERSQLAREDLLLHTTVFLNQGGTNATATLAKLPQGNHFFLLTAQHVARILEEKGEKWFYQNPKRVVACLNHPHTRTDLGDEKMYSPDLTLFELHAEDAAEMVRLGLNFYDLGTAQYSSEVEYGPDYFVIGAPKSAEVIVNRELNFEIRSAGVNVLEDFAVNGAATFVEVEAIEADYSGMSGGGLWEISYPASGGHRIFLAGVVVGEPQLLQSTADSSSSVGFPRIRCSSVQSIRELVARARCILFESHWRKDAEGNACHYDRVSASSYRHPARDAGEDDATHQRRDRPNAKVRRHKADQAIPCHAQLASAPLLAGQFANQQLFVAASTIPAPRG